MLSEIIKKEVTSAEFSLLYLGLMMHSKIAKKKKRPKATQGQADPYK